jgi:hypothetical protein
MSERMFFTAEMGARLRRGGMTGPGPKLSSVADYVKQNRLNPELVERIRKLVIEQHRH